MILKDHGADIDLTKNVKVLEVSDGAPISATITLNAKDGRYLTKNPIIQKWDRIYIQITDKFGKSFQTVVHVKKIKKNRTLGKGLECILVCPHQSSNLLTVTISKPNLRTSGYAAMNDVLSVMKGGTKDPVIEIPSTFDIEKKTGNRLSKATSNNYIFEAVKAETAIDEIIKREGDVVENGGAFEFHFFRLQSLYNHSTNQNLDKVVPQIFEQGYKKNGNSFTNQATVTLKKNAITQAPSNYLATEGSEETELATNLIAVGAKNAGSYPTNYSIYQGEKDFFRLAPLWDGNFVNYKQGMRVSHNGIFYKATIDHTSSPPNPPPNALWVIDNTFIPSVDYSPLTKNKAQYWVNASGGWIHFALSTNRKPAIVDHNIVIKDQRHYRTWVDLAETNSANLSIKNVLLNGKPFDGLRVLVNGTGSGAFAGNDPNGKSKSNAVLEWRGDQDTGAWYVFRSAQTDDEVYSFREGESWIYKPCEGALSYVDGNGVCQLGTRNSGWVRGAYLAVTVGIDTFGKFFADEQFDCVHPIKRNTSNVIELGNEKILNQDDTSGTSAVFANFDVGATGRSFFAGLNFAFPFPRNSNSIPYDPVNIGEQIKLFVFDLLNMHQNHLGGREWIGKNTEDYYPIQSFAFFQKLEAYLGSSILEPAGDYKFNLWLADRNDNILIIDYTQSHNNSTLAQDVPIMRGKVYRGRVGISSWLPLNEIEVLDIFDFKSIVRGGIETADSFDEVGRYRMGFQTLPNLFRNDSRFYLLEKLKISIDAFRMVKPLVATNLDSTPEHNIEAQKIKADHIFSYVQLKNMVKSLARIFTFERKEYRVTTAGRCDIQFGDPVYYTDSEIIPTTTDGLQNTEKLVANKIIYTISKTVNGTGGFLRTVELINRIWT